MSAPHRVRVLTPDDADAVARVLGVSFGWALPHLASLHTPEADRRFVRERLFGSAEVSGAFVANELIGYIAWRPQWIDHLYVLPEFAERGIGTALIDDVKAHERRIDLWTSQNNTRARRFYEARGFLEIERTDGANNEEREPDVLYRWLAN